MYRYGQAPCKHELCFEDECSCPCHFYDGYLEEKV